MSDVLPSSSDKNKRALENLKLILSQSAQKHPLPENASPAISKIKIKEIVQELQNNPKQSFSEEEIDILLGHLLD